MIIADIKAAICSIAAFVYTIINVTFVLRLPAAISKLTPDISRLKPDFTRLTAEINVLSAEKAILDKEIVENFSALTQDRLNVINAQLRPLTEELRPIAEEYNLLTMQHNAKTIVLVTMIIISVIILVKLVSSVGKIVYYQFSVRKDKEAVLGKTGLIPRLYNASNTVLFRRISALINLGIALYAGTMLVLVLPFGKYWREVGRRTVLENEVSHKAWELNWFLPMLQFFTVIFTISLLISILRYIIVSVKKEYNEVYAVAQSRKKMVIRCISCGFDNHTSSVCCGNCGEDMRLAGKTARGIG